MNDTEMGSLRSINKMYEAERPDTSTSSPSGASPDRAAERRSPPLAALGLAGGVLLLTLGAGLDAARAGTAPQLSTLQQERAERDVLLNLEQRKRALDAREKDLDRREERLQEATASLEGRLRDLESLRGELKALIAEEQSIKDKKYKEMASIHAAMPTARSAEILAALDDAVAVRIMGNLPDARVAKTLAKMPPERALSLSEAYMGLKRGR